MGDGDGLLVEGSQYYSGVFALQLAPRDGREAKEAMRELGHMSGAVWASDRDRAVAFARRMRTGQVGSSPAGRYGQGRPASELAGDLSPRTGLHTTGA